MSAADVDVEAARYPAVIVPWAARAPSPPAGQPCSELAHIGDSTSVALPRHGIEEAYAAAGVTDLRFEADGGRSLVEHRPENENGVMVAKRLTASGFRGCWVIALGTNDAANFARSDSISPRKRIVRLMDVIGDQPVMWVDVKTLKNRGYYSSTGMELWNRELDVLDGYPNAVIYRWSDDAEDGWFTSDGIHYTAEGSKARAAAISGAAAALLNKPR